MPETQYDIVRARVNEADLQSLRAQGITRPWFIGSSGNVVVRTRRGVPVPVAALIMKTSKTQRVVFRDGNPMNLTRANLAVVERQSQGSM